MIKKLSPLMIVFIFAIFLYSDFFGSVNAKTINTGFVSNGDVVKTLYSDDVYIIKIINDKKLKRLILNPEIFNSYGHLKWENIKTIDNLDEFDESDLVREVYADGSLVNGKIYKLYPYQDSGMKVLFENIYDEDGVYNINHIEASDLFYRTILNIERMEKSLVKPLYSNNKVFLMNDNMDFSVYACDNLYNSNAIIKHIIENLNIEISVCVLDSYANNILYNMDNFRGLYDFKYNFIVVNEDIKFNHQNRALFHEFIHAVQDNYLESIYNYHWNQSMDWSDTAMGDEFINIVEFEKVGSDWILPRDSIFVNMYNYNPTELFAETGALWLAVEYKEINPVLSQNIIDSFSEDLGEEKVALLIDGIYNNEELLEYLIYFFEG